MASTGVRRPRHAELRENLMAAQRVHVLRDDGKKVAVWFLDLPQEERDSMFVEENMDNLLRVVALYKEDIRKRILPKVAREETEGEGEGT